MDLTRQPPRRPSNTGIAGIAGLARMADKARGHMAGTIGEFKYGDDSGLDREVLALIGEKAGDFADAAANMWDRELHDWVRSRMTCTAGEIDRFNGEQITRLPQDELHRRLLKERLAKYAPGNSDVTTVFGSIELDDWGAFRDEDLTARPPRSGYVRSVLGLVAAARMADKARAHRAGRMGDYRYGDDSFFDRALLEFLRLSAAEFEEGSWRNPNDTELGEWILKRAAEAGLSAFEAEVLLDRMRAKREMVRAQADHRAAAWVGLRRRAARRPSGPDALHWPALPDSDGDRCSP